MKTTPVDIVLLDIDTLEIEPGELLSDLRRSGCRIPVLAVTLSDSPFDPVGTTGRLRKPLVATSVRRALREACLQKWVDEQNVLLDQYPVVPPDPQTTLRNLTGASFSGPLAN